ncbi:probable cyclin-dependent serine/threonine-protein kinase DDB_G0292550 [Rhizophagus clarus]|uniref:Probable cyclin-dependent serine/threonine-protein kinase DDB_G0292550 n=1 Tax=Rhizophagus clarus TaxID=94130 RepID=A0A8H3LC46_9GLOM|nr:probable cyclin-dependent serine/threonine-protein kinase DDB_G0292550 [Rhizophagus clarus]
MSQWKHQLRNRKQRAGETIDEYTSAMEELWKRIDPKRKRTELDQISEYVEGLRPEFIVPVQSAMPQTVKEAINKAKATETAFSMGTDLSAYSLTPGYLPNLYGAAIPAQVAHAAFVSQNLSTPSVVTDSIEEIIERKLKEQIERVLNRNNYNNSYNNSSNNNIRRNNRDKECYNCNKKGHIAREC